MEITTRRAYDDMDLKIRMGDLLINVLYIRFIPAAGIWHIRNHCHSSYELHFIPFGKGTLVSGGRSYAIDPGTFYLTGPQVYHEQISEPADPMAECCINFEVSVCRNTRREADDFLQDEIDEIARTLFETKFWFGRDEHGSIDVFQKIMDELDGRLVGYYLNIRNYVSQIIINAVRCCNNQKKALYDLPSKTLYDKRMHILDRLLDCGYHKDLSLDQLADEMKVSRRQLNRIIKRHYATTFKRRVTDLKLERAKEMLLGTEMSIEKIAEEAGYASTSYFCKRFKERTGITPTQFRSAPR